MASFVENFVHQLRSFYQALSECTELTRDLVTFNQSTWSAIADVQPELRDGWASNNSGQMRFALREIENAKPKIDQLQRLIENVMDESNRETRNYIDATIGNSVFECDYNEEPVASCWRRVEPCTNQILNGLSEWNSCNLNDFNAGNSNEFETLYMKGLEVLLNSPVPCEDKEIRAEFRIVRDRHVSTWHAFPDSKSAGKAMNPKLSDSSVRSKCTARGKRQVIKDDDGTWWIHEELLRPSDSD